MFNLNFFWPFAFVPPKGYTPPKPECPHCGEKVDAQKSHIELFNGQKVHMDCYIKDKEKSDDETTEQDSETGGD